jgi:hypothetical protein
MHFHAGAWELANKIVAVNLRILFCKTYPTKHKVNLLYSHRSPISIILTQGSNAGKILTARLGARKAKGSDDCKWLKGF